MEKVKFVVLDLQTIEVCDSLDDAHSIVNDYIEGCKTILREEDDERIILAIKKPPLCNLEQGDIEIYEIPDNELEEYKSKYCSGIIYEGVRIRNDYEPIEVFSGLSVFKEEADRRGLQID